MLNLFLYLYFLTKGLGSKIQLSCRFFRSSQRRCSIKKGVLQNFPKFTGKQQCQSLYFFQKIACLRSATLLKKETLSQVFRYKFCKIFMNVFFTELLRKTAANFFLSENLIIDVGKRLFSCLLKQNCSLITQECNV